MAGCVLLSFGLFQLFLRHPRRFVRGLLLGLSTVTVGSEFLGPGEFCFERRHVGRVSEPVCQLVVVALAGVAFGRHFDQRAIGCFLGRENSLGRLRPAEFLLSFQGLVPLLVGFVCLGCQFVGPGGLAVHFGLVGRVGQ